MSMRLVRRPFRVLVVEDNPADARLVNEALNAGEVAKSVATVGTGDLALSYRYRRGEYADAPRPDLILLDLNLPGTDGLEVLRTVKADPELRTITVVVLTTSQAQPDVNAAYSYAANCYLVKPMLLDEFFSMMRGLEDFWMILATLPGTESPPSPPLDTSPQQESERKRRLKSRHRPTRPPESGSRIAPVISLRRTASAAG